MCFVNLDKTKETDVFDDSTSQTTASPRSSGRSRSTSPHAARRFEWADEYDSDDDNSVQPSVVDSSEGTSSQASTQQTNGGTSNQVFMPCMMPAQNQMFQQWTMVPVSAPFMPCTPSGCYAQPFQLVGVTFQPVNQVPVQAPAQVEAANAKLSALQARADALAARAKELREAVRQSQSGSAKAKITENTTLILKNLPVGCTQEGLRKILDELGLAGLYDFIYVPFDFKKLVALRYGYVNFEQHADAVKAMAILDGYSGWVVGSEKPCEVEWSGAQQGLYAHIERYRNSPVMHATVPEEYKPVLLQNGIRIAFPPPTQVVKPPKMRLAQQQ